MSLAGPLIQAGAGLLGGLFNKGASAGKNFRSHINGLMAAANQHGINPLALLNVPPVGPSQGNVFMSQAIADAGAILGDAMLKRQDAQKLQRAEQQNAYLQKKVTDLTLRPKVPGVYQQFPGVGNGQGSGGVYQTGGVGNAGGAGGGPTPLLSDQALAEKDTEEISGFMKIRNRFAPDGFYVPGSDGEPLDIWQLPVVGGAWAIDKALRWRDGKRNPEIAETVKKGIDVARNMTWGTPLRAPDYPPRPSKLYGKPYDDSQRFAPMPPVKKPKRKSKHPLNSLGF